MTKTQTIAQMQERLDKHSTALLKAEERIASLLRSRANLLAACVALTKLGWTIESRNLLAKAISDHQLERKSLINRIVAAARRRPPEIAERRKSKGSDGNYYGAGGMPTGVKWTGEHSEPYYVRMSHEGTTYGKPEATREALQASIQADQDLADNEFRDTLELMNDPALEDQVKYWLK